MASSSLPQSTENLPGEEAYEEKNVHEVYQQIAEHFSSTRYKVRSMPYLFDTSVN
jgi:tRNA (uracil-5-)-methyltransferase TRM9